MKSICIHSPAKTRVLHPGGVLLRPIFSALAAIALPFLTSATAQDPAWETLPQSIDGRAKHIISDHAGAIYVAGELIDVAGNYHAAILKSIDRGESWDSNAATPELDPCFYMEEGGTSFTALAAARVEASPGLFQDHLVAIVFTQSGYHVVRSVDGGGSWSTIASPADLNFGTSSGGTLWRVSLDQYGNVYLAARGSKTVTTISKGKAVTTTESRWLVFKGSLELNAEGQETYAWRLIDDAPGRTEAIACHGTDILVAGVNGAFWEVRRSADGGASWAVVDHFQLEAGYAATPYSLTVDDFGRVIVAGAAAGKGKVGSSDYWVVRAGSATGPNSFTAVDSFQARWPSPRAATVARDGSVFLNGWIGGSSGVRVWYTRRGTFANGNWSWAPDDNHSFDAGRFAQGNGVAANHLGDVFAIGQGDGSGSWLVRRKLSPQAPLAE